MDEVRGFCILCMILYHALLLLDQFFSVQTAATLWHWLSYIQPLYVVAFVVISGISSRLSHSNRKRGLKLAIISVCITILTVPVAHAIHIQGVEDYFGVLHCLAACILLFAAMEGLLTKVKPEIGIPVCVVFYGISTLFFPMTIDGGTNAFFWLGIHNAGFASMDYCPLLPLVFPFFLGTFLGVFVKEGRIPDWTYRSHVRFFAFTGRHTLWIYLAHVPILYGLFWLYFKLF
jgi:uncharacterized membrane protein